MQTVKRYTPKFLVIAFGVPDPENDTTVYRGDDRRKALRELKEAHTGGGRCLMYGPDGITDPEDVWGDSVFPTGDKD